MTTSAAATFLQFGTTDGKNHQVFTLTKEQFMQVMQENGIKCGNCANWHVYDHKCNALSISQGDRVIINDSNFFCASFNPKSNG